MRNRSEMMGRCKRAEHCGNPSWCKTTGKCLKAQPAEAPHATADMASARAVIEQCRAALAEELSAWDIDPPLHHVKEAHDACVAWLAGPNAAMNGGPAGAENNPGGRGPSVR